MSENPEYRNASDSIRSLMVLHLKHEVTLIPPEMMPYYNSLLNLNKSL